MSLVDWADRLEAPLGVGVDLVEIGELKALNQRTRGAFVQRTFTPREKAEAESSSDPWVYLAGRFAVKEAVLKALASLTPDKTFDFRVVETLRNPDGSPQVTQEGKLREIMQSAMVGRVLVSISNEAGYALAFAVAVAKQKHIEI